MAVPLPMPESIPPNRAQSNRSVPARGEGNVNFHGKHVGDQPCKEGITADGVDGVKGEEFSSVF